MQLNVYIANLGKYNKGILQGDWFTLPVVLDAVKSRIGINERYEEWAIHDYEAPFEIHEYESLEKLNEIALLFKEHSSSRLLKHIKVFLDNDSIEEVEEFFEYIDDYIIHECNSMEEVAINFIEEAGYFKDALPIFENYFDFEKFGRHMEQEGHFYHLDDCIVERPW